ncbi:MAG TPA: hypothetical protein VFE82_19920 [Ramlibacter sp.]|jgi:hypothetical protein|uniref:hypothetical protein n=1 Tax=Ramlibacter sp. TaxID=1917967 RepID=UPI002D7045FA|nr:hypothetical protein [Ramlibacter sp.]HZY20746.1 hypothetical protein [Ramlibacter sp.]
MTAIDASHRLALLLRTQVSAFKAPQAAHPKRKTASHGAGPPADVAALAARRIQALSPEDPDRKRKALRIFLECLLLQQFGQDLLRDSSFAEMVDSVQVQMEADREVAAAAAALSEILLADPARR